jgi:hypothetical protein
MECIFFWDGLYDDILVESWIFQGKWLQECQSTLNTAGVLSNVIPIKMLSFVH